MRRSLTLTLIALLTLGVLAGGVLAQGPPDHAGLPSAEVLETNNYDRTPSPPYANDENIIDSLELDSGDWLVSASGAANYGSEGAAPNCGLRLDNGDGSIMIAKQNFDQQGEGGRSGFSVTGAAEGNSTVNLVCYGDQINVFEYDLTAIGG